MYIVKAEANQVEKIVDMSVRAFETDVYVGGAKGDCPPGFDSVEWHEQMAREGHLYQAMIGKDLVGAAIVFPDETENSVYIGRIFIDSIDGYPDSNAAFIGFFMMNRQLQGRQIGTSMIQELCLYLKETGLKRVLLGIDKENPQSNAFWAKNGFSVIREVEQEDGTILLAEKCM